MAFLVYHLEVVEFPVFRLKTASFIKRIASSVFLNTDIMNLRKSAHGS